MRPLPLPLLLAACAPFADVAERESAWYTPVDVAAQGIGLAELVDGAPIGHWPRVTLSPTAAGFDNRAWFLTRDEHVLRMDAPEAVRDALLVEAPGAVALDAGAFPEGALRGWFAGGLYDPAERAMEARWSGPAEGEPIPHADAIAILPDASVPWRSVQVALYSSLQAGFPAYALVGAHGGHLRSALWGRPAPHGGAWCAGQLRAHIGADGIQLGHAWGPPLADAEGRCRHPTDAALAAAISAVAAGCGDRWRALEGELQTADPAAWSCVEVWISVDPTHRAGPALRSLSALGAIGDAVVTGPLVGAPDPRIQSCPSAPRIDTLTPQQWDLLCGAADVRAWVEADRAAGASDDVFARLRGRGRRTHPGPETIAAVFPRWDAATPDPRRATVQVGAPVLEDTP